MSNKLHPVNYNSIPICEASWSRIFQHIESANSFAVISAFTLKRHIDGKDSENYQAHQQLKNDVKSLKLGFIEQLGGYPYKVEVDSGETIEGVSDEMSLFIPNISYDQAMMLGKKYDQESIIFKDDKRFVLVYTKNFTDKEDNIHHVGEVDMNFNAKTETREVKKGETGANLFSDGGRKQKRTGVITFDPEVLKYAFSKLRHGNKGQREQKFAYVVECVGLIEYRVPTSTEAMLAQKRKDGEYPKATGMRLF